MNEKGYTIECSNTKLVKVDPLIQFSHSLSLTHIHARTHFHHFFQCPFGKVGMKEEEKGRKRLLLFVRKEKGRRKQWVQFLYTIVPPTNEWKGRDGLSPFFNFLAFKN